MFTSVCLKTKWQWDILYGTEAQCLLWAWFTKGIMTIHAQENMLQIGKCDSYLSPLVLSASLGLSTHLRPYSLQHSEYTDILIFNFPHIIYPQRCLMSHYIATLKFSSSLYLSASLVSLWRAVCWNNFLWSYQDWFWKINNKQIR